MEGVAEALNPVSASWGMAIEHVTVTLAIPFAVSKLTGVAMAVVQLMTANSVMFPSPMPPLAKVTSDVAALDEAEVATMTRVMGSVPVRDEMKKAVVVDLRQLRAYVQMLIANLDPEAAAKMAACAGMSVRKAGSRSKNALVCKPQKLSAAVPLVAKAVKRGIRASYEWQFSLDGSTWTSAPPTLQAKTTIENLPTGVRIWFRSRAITKVGPGNWTAPISMLVA